MKLVSACVGLAALGGIALSSEAASAAPIDVPVSASGMVVPAGYVCNEWGHCWHRHYYGGGYYHPQYYYHPQHWSGYGYGGWGWHRHWRHGYHWRHWRHWHRWHHWHRWYRY